LTVSIFNVFEEKKMEYAYFCEVWQVKSVEEIGMERQIIHRIHDEI
jgi:hypothetical protein